MAMSSSQEVDTVIIGNGPSALILSYILHGHIPYYSGRHDDGLLNRNLGSNPNLLNVTPDVYHHIRSSINYSTQALPVNVLLDTLLRPKGDTNVDVASCIEWRHEPDKAVSHIVLGDAPATGGQWVDNPVAASWDIGTLSYAEQLTLPGYTISDHWRKVKRQKLPELIRPTRREVAEYLAAYPKAVGIEKVMRASAHVRNVTRTRNGFHITPQNIRCRHLVLATGIFTINLPPPSFLTHLTLANDDFAPVLVIGSGFTAADIIISTPSHRKIIHIFNWDPNNRPSPLKSCHASAYPDYAWIYKQMRRAGDRMMGRLPDKDESALPPDGVAANVKRRDWRVTYEGFGNARILATSLDVDYDGPIAKPQPVAGWRGSHIPATPSGALTINIGRSSIGDSIRRKIGSFRYAVGRRGSLSFLSMPLFQEIVPESPFSGRGSMSRDSMSIADSDRPRSSQGLGPQRSASVAIGSPLALGNSDARRSSHAGHTDNRGLSSPQSDTVAHATPSHLLLPEPLAALRRGSVEIDFAFEAKPTLKISGQTLRPKVEAGQDEVPFASGHSAPARTQGFEVAPSVFVIGSLTGDSLIRFAYGGCAVVAGKLMRDAGLLPALPEPSTHFHTTYQNSPAQPQLLLDGQPLDVDNQGGLFTDNFSMTHSAHVNGNGQLQPRRSSDGTDVDPSHPQPTEYHLRGQDQADVEEAEHQQHLAAMSNANSQAASRASSVSGVAGGQGGEAGGASWLARRSLEVQEQGKDRRASLQENVSQGHRKGSIFGRVKDIIKADFTGG